MVIDTDFRILTNTRNTFIFYFTDSFFQENYNEPKNSRTIAYFLDDAHFCNAPLGSGFHPGHL